MLKRILFLTLCIAFSLSPATAQEEDLSLLLDKITKRLDSHSDNDWSYKLTTKVHEMDKSWNPEKTVITTAVIQDIDGRLSAELLKVEQIENSVVEDITQTLVEQTRKQIENANKQRAESEGGNASDDSADTFLPFSGKKRAKFIFNRLDDIHMDGRAIIVIEAKAKEKDGQLFEGKFHIDPLTFEVLGAHISPSQNPKFVKEMEMDIDFEVLPEGKFFRRRSRTRVSGGILFKRFRVIAEEEYSEVRVLD